MAELGSFVTLYLERVGPDRPLAAFVHPMDFRTPGLRTLVHSMGAIPSTYEAGCEALAAGVPVVVFPGGDHESLKPFWQGNRVDFGGRTGFLRLARDARVPIVPMGIRGGYLTAPILLRSTLLATLLVTPRLLGIKRWGLSLLGVVVATLLALFLPFPWPATAAVIWLWLGSPPVFLACIPWKVRLRIGPPIPPDELFGPRNLPEAPDTLAGPARRASGDAQLNAALARVQATVQGLVDGDDGDSGVTSK
jgi:1-acyl-sn-glycerol-3-phosphate acyltransferase